MVQSSENIWTPRFQLLVGLCIAGQILLGVLVYTNFGYLYGLTELALTAFLLLCGAGILGSLHEPTPRKIVLSAGFFVLITLLTLIASSGFQQGITGSQAANSIRLLLSYWVCVLALLALLGKVVIRNVALSEESTEDWTAATVSQPTSWFIRLSHLVLVGMAGVELLLQIAFGNQLLLLPFASRLYAGVSLNSVAVLLRAAILVCSLFRFKSPLKSFDGWMILVLSVACSLLQYTFGPVELAHVDPAMSQSLLVGINLALSLIPLALAIFALFSEWGRFFAALWLAVQLLIQQQFLSEPLARSGGGDVLRSVHSVTTF